MTWKDWFRLFLHAPVGLVAFGGFMLNWAIGMAFTFGFFLYELNEDMHLSDKAYKDLMGWLVGMALGIIWSLWNLFHNTSL